MHSIDQTSRPPGWRPSVHVGAGDNPSPVAKLLDLIVTDALNDQHIQVHLTMADDRIRFSRGDSWSEYMRLPLVATQRLINRIRVLANLDRIKGNARQEGSIGATMQGDQFHIRAAVQFTSEGHEEAFLNLPEAPIHNG